MGEFDRKREDRLPGLNWNCHVRASEANQRKNNLYRIEFNCELCRRPCLPSSTPLPPSPPPSLPPPPLADMAFATIIAANSAVGFREPIRLVEENKGEPARRR